MSNTVTQSGLQEGQIKLVGRISYPKLWRAEHFKNDPNSAKRYGCQILVPKSDTEAKKRIDAEVARLSKLYFKGAAMKAKALFYKDGDGEDGDEFSKGCWIVSANRSEKQGRPQVVDRNRTPLSEDDDKIRAGYQCVFILSIYKPKGYDILAASLEVIQFKAKDEEFGAGRINIDSALEDLPDEDDDI
jgi:Protein of unknown function (DUF2815)